MLQTILLVLHVLVAIGLITFILLQQGKGANTGAAFGAGASGTVFGARGAASFMSRTTAVLAVVFFANCLLLAFLAAQQKKNREPRGSNRGESAGSQCARRSRCAEAGGHGSADRAGRRPAAGRSAADPASQTVMVRSRAIKNLASRATISYDSIVV